MNPNPNRKTYNQIIVKYAIMATGLYILYFFIMKLAGLAYITELRFVNYFLYCIVGYYALKEATHKGGERLSYLRGIGIAFFTGALSFLMFAGFVFLYSYVDPFFIKSFLAEFPTGNVFGRFGAPFSIASEGIGLSTVLALCLMQYFKIYSNRKRAYLFFGKKREIAQIP